MERVEACEQGCKNNISNLTNEKVKVTSDNKNVS